VRHFGLPAVERARNAVIEARRAVDDAVAFRLPSRLDDRMPTRPRHRLFGC
jgi:hypothetical protein